MRASIIDAETLKEIEKRRQSLRSLITKFTFGLADNMRWIPSAARKLFESQLVSINAEGQKLIADLLKGDIDGFINGKRDQLSSDITAMHEAMGRPGKMAEGVIDTVVADLKNRLEKAQLANFMPSLS
jgi:hypothetical protein